MGCGGTGPRHPVRSLTVSVVSGSVSGPIRSRVSGPTTGPSTQRGLSGCLLDEQRTRTHGQAREKRNHRLLPTCLTLNSARQRCLTRGILSNRQSQELLLFLPDR